MKPSSSPHISVVIPVFGCADCLVNLHSRLVQSLEKVTRDFEIILVDDGSNDGAWEIILDLANLDRRVNGIRLSRNFGQHPAIAAGLDACGGDWVVVMDCDLQDPPEEIPHLYDKATQGFDLVVARRATRNDPWTKKATSKLFWWIYQKFTSTKSDAIGNFGMYSRTAIESIREIKELNFSFGRAALWVGLRRTEVGFERMRRVSGFSRYSFSKLLVLGLRSLVADSATLLKATAGIGLVIGIVATLAGIALALRHFLQQIPVPGWTSLIVALAFSTGIIVFAIGIVGLYVGEIYEQVKSKPRYVVQDSTGDKYG